MVDPDTMSVVELYHVHVASAESSQGVSVSIELPFVVQIDNRKLTCGIFKGSRHDQKERNQEDPHAPPLLLHARLRPPHRRRHRNLLLPLRRQKAALRLRTFPSQDFQRGLLELHREAPQQLHCLHRFGQFRSHKVLRASKNSLLTNIFRRDMYIVAHVMRVGRMLYSESSSKKPEKNAAPLQQVFRRPHGVAVQNMGDVVAKEGDSEEREFTLKVYQAEEKDFYQLHEFIIRQSGKYSALSCQPNYGIIISLKMLHGELNQIKEDNPLLFKNISLTNKLGFPDVIMPGDVRNDLYLTLEKGEFERGGKSTGKNIEVTVLVLDSEKNVVRVS